MRGRFNPLPASPLPWGQWASAQGAGARLLPEGYATGQVTPLHQSLESPIGAIARHLPGYERDQTLYDAGVGASREVDLFGGLRRGAAAARDEAEIAEAEHLGTRISVAAEAADAYLQVRDDRARLALGQSQVSTDARLLDLVRLRFRDGIGTDRGVAQAEALLAQARGTLPPLRRALEAELNRLDVVLGAASNARIGAALAEYYPKLSLSALLGVESLSADHFLTAAAFQPLASGALRWRLFDLGRVDAEVAQADGAHAEALARYRQAVLRAAEDVEDAFMALVQEEAGAIALTDLLDADRELLVAQDRRALSRADAARAAVASFRALGGGW